MYLIIFFAIAAVAFFAFPFVVAVSAQATGVVVSFRVCGIVVVVATNHTKSGQALFLRCVAIIPAIFPHSATKDFEFLGVGCWGGNIQLDHFWW